MQSDYRAESEEDRDRTVYVIGHRNPDTDSICAAVGYAAFLNATRMPGARAARCGDVNERTAWVLERAGLPLPRLVMDVRPTALSISRRKVVKAAVHETFLDVYRRLTRGGVRCLPVVDSEGRVVGMPTFFELLQLLLPGDDPASGTSGRELRASLADVARAVGGTLTNPQGGDVEEDFVMLVGASTVNTIRDRAARFEGRSLMVIVGDRPRVQRLAIESGARCLVLTAGSELSPELEGAAAQAGTCVVSSKHDTATTTQLLRCARRVAGVLDRDFLSFTAHTLVRDILPVANSAPQVLFPVTDADTGALLGVFSKSDLVDPPVARLVLVDHNEFSQAVTGADEAEVLEVIDHHRLSGNLRTKEPVRFVNEPVGSTSTIVARFFRDAGLTPEPGVALCLAAGVIADTLTLTSPTTTDTDRDLLPWLAGVAGVEIEAFANEFFSAGSMLRSLPPEDAVGADRKEFDEGGWKISISQIEELGLDEFWKQEEALEAALERLCNERGLDFACLMVTDISKHTSLLVTAGNERVAGAIEYPELRRSLYELRGVVSRKKQLFPHLSRILSRIPKGAPQPG
jgi:manganese-dependent inorganic pyrophosphatase